MFDLPDFDWDTDKPNEQEANEKDADERRKPTLTVSTISMAGIRIGKHGAETKG